MFCCLFFVVFCLSLSANHHKTSFCFLFFLFFFVIWAKVGNSQFFVDQARSVRCSAQCLSPRADIPRLRIQSGSFSPHPVAVVAAVALATVNLLS